MLVRLVLLIVVVFAVLWLLKKLFRDTAADKLESAEPRKVEDMHQCHYCGTHVPDSLVIESKQHHYCCQDHADRDHA